jgi:hypothetical protein
MNQKTTYEVTITSKLDQLPIPDLRNAIWARIEGELDADMPTDDGGDTPPSSPRGGNVLPYALPGIVVIIITLFLINSNKQNSKPNHLPTNTPATQTITTTPIASPPPVDTKAIIPDKKDPVVYPGTNVPISTIGNNADSVAAPVTDIIPPVTDNTNQQAPPLVQTPAPPPQKTDSVTQKKKRGVSGITNDDYRITPAKPDSSRKN